MTNEELYTAANNYKVYPGDFVEQFGSFYVAVSKDHFTTLGRRKRVLKSEDTSLTHFSIIRRMINYGLLTARLLTDAEDVLPEPQVKYLETVADGAIWKLQNSLGSPISTDRQLNEWNEEVLLIWDSETDVDLASIPIEDYFQAYVDVFTDSTSNPTNVSRKLADKLTELVKKFKVFKAEGDNDEES